MLFSESSFLYLSYALSLNTDAVKLRKDITLFLGCILLLSFFLHSLGTEESLNQKVSRIKLSVPVVTLPFRRGNCFYFLV